MIEQAIARQYYRWRRVIPKRLLYHPDHFLVRALLDDRPEVRDHIANVRLRHILSTAVTHVPFYRNTVRIPARDLALAPPAELLERFPYIDKETVAMAMEFDCVDVPEIPAAPGGKRRFVVNELLLAPL